MPSVRTRTFALRRPFERPAPACPCHAALPPRDRLSTPFHRRGPFGPRRPGYRSRVPLPPDTRFSLASATLADFCNLYTTRGHTQRAFDPRTRVAGTNRCRLRWPFDALPHRGLRATTCAKRVAGRNAREKARRVSRTMSRMPSSWRSGHPGRRRDRSRGLEFPARFRSGQDPSRMPPRERQHRWKNRGAFCRNGTLTRPTGCPFVRAGTAAPSRRLRGGIARGFARLLRPHATACL